MIEQHSSCASEDIDVWRCFRGTFPASLCTVHEEFGWKVLTIGLGNRLQFGV